MTPEAINVAIAEWCGWRHEYDTTQLKAVWISPKSGYAYDLGDRLFPDYFNDLNSIHEAALKLGPDKGSSYAMELRQIVVRDQTPDMQGLVVLQNHGKPEHYLSDLYFYESTAPQRCEALLRCIGKWVD